MHKIERLIDIFKRHRMRNQIIDIQFAIHVPVDDLRHVRPSASPTESRTAPYSPRYELERAGWEDRDDTLPIEVR